MYLILSVIVRKNTLMKTLNKSESRTKKFMHNSLTTAFYQVIIMVAGFITPRVMLTCYGSEINGLVSSIQQFINYFTLVEAGISGAAVFSLYLPLAENDHKRINSIVSAARKFYFQAGYICSPCRHIGNCISAYGIDYGAFPYNGWITCTFVGRKRLS